MVRLAVVVTALLAPLSGTATAEHAQARSGNAAPWSATPLTWSQYQGKPDMAGDAAAMTVYNVLYEEECVGSAFTFRVVSYFEPAQSWVKSSALANFTSRSRLLSHEQGHFDLSEIMARRLRRVLAELPNACGQTAESRKALVTRHLRDNAAEQGRYDRQTDFGRSDANQLRWEADIERQLASLAKFSDAVKRQ